MINTVKYLSPKKTKENVFERLMQAYLLTDPKYAYKFKKVWLWNEFPGRNDLGGNDTGIDLVGLTNEGDYWAIQCKCYQESSSIDKPAVDSFLATSSRQFKGEDLKTHSFAHRLWISTTNKWGSNAQEAIKNQNPPVSRINLFDLISAPIDWEKLDNGITGEVARTHKKQLRPHQTEALTNTNQHFKNHDRGKLIMACGTGKTFTSLRIAENETNGNGLVLFLVPSIALLGQTLNEWYADAVEPINAICICSDPEITKNRKKLEDIDTSSVVDLALPASTNVENIVHQFRALEFSKNKGLTVVFSTYQSIEVIAKAQKALLKDWVQAEGERVKNKNVQGDYLNLSNNENTNVQRTHRLEGSHELGGDDLHYNKKLPEGGTIRTNQPNEESSGVNTSEYSGGLRTENKKGISSISDDSQRINSRIRNTHLDSSKDTLSKSDGNGENNQSDSVSKQNTYRFAEVPESNTLNPYIFDLIICDEAHRTTGVSLADEDESAFTKVHNNDFIKAKKRLYMTATPRLYDDNTKSKAAQADALLCSMDDVSMYGEEIYRIGFGEAVEKDLLTDYKVLILTLNENDVPPAVQKMIADKESEINTDDASKLIGCINALSKQILGDEGIIKDTDPEPMRRAVAFCQSIAVSKKITTTFNVASDSYISELPTEKQATMQMVASKHIDGSMNATERDELLSWLKEEPAEKECRILTNVRCLSEGVDVPSLDAVLFLSARNSQVDVVQSVGRVMRKAPNKKYGYIIIPVVVPTDVEADKALDDNERYKVVWTVLNALRAHDDRFNATVNKIELNKKRPDQILVGRPEISFDKDGNPIYETELDNGADRKNIAEQLSLQFEQLQSVVFARMVQKVGDRRYWEQWAKSVADIATRQTERITNLIAKDNKHQKAFELFLAGLHKNINPSITQAEAIEMLSQHIITKPVFDALFEGYSFVQHNPMSQSMQKMLDLLEEQALEKDAETLEKFYESVKMRAAGIDNAEGKQRIIIELYDKFFKTAFPKMVEKLGIVYTPVEVVDFIIHSVADILKKEFDRDISDENVHLLDPFTGTGTFITRLLQSGLIKQKDLERKYRNEIHANEIVLLAYYIASVNIENAFHDATENPDDGIGKDQYIPFEGICLTDTFQLGETADGEKLFSEMFPQNSQRVQRQKKAPLRIIFGNPPYSIGQKSANDNAQNQSYPKLDQRIADTYAKQSSAGLNKSLYDAYIKAFRWSTDNLDKNGGIIAFVSNGAWLDGNSTDGFRKSIEKEFSSIYVFNLRGNQRTSGELSRKEGGKIFGSGSRTPISITLLVKNPAVKTEKATIHYHDIGDYLTREEKLKIVSNFKTFAHPQFPFKTLQPNEHGDWISMRNDAFDTYIPLEPEKKFANKSQSIFTVNVVGIATGRDAWSLNFSQKNLSENMQRMISFFNEQSNAFAAAKLLNQKLEVESFIDQNPKQISWTRSLRKDISKNIKHTFNPSELFTCLYRPYTKEWMYYDRPFIESPSIWSQIFPTKNHKNIVISCMNVGSNKEFSTIISDSISEYQLVFANQSFPLYYYEENKNLQKGLFDEDSSQDYIRRDAISDFILERAQKQYGKTVTKEDIFYYVYGFLHSKEYRETFANDLKKMLPRLPLVETVKDFWAFSKAGRKLAELHLNYESVEPFADVKVTGADSNFFTVEKMRFPKKGEKDSIIYNSKISISNIPAKAYEYVVNGKSAIEWIMERYQITTHKESGIVNNPNDWATEVGNPRYILDLLLSIINVSVQTVDIVNALPKVDFGADSTDKKVVKMYPTLNNDEQLSKAAEPENDE
ncbi:MAG: Type III restriction enzyme, res subunit [Bacteroidetes bacterium OLB9]|nr:MAG: Type III restriction enzyme, res subunit [Bacteroidetes bacterium OLB9]